MRLLSLIFINLRRHRIRATIGVAGIGFGVAAMLTILAIVTGAIGMFERILATDSHYLVFERNVSDLFFSSVTMEQVDAVRAQPEVESANPLLFGIVSAPGHPIITCFGVDPADPRLARAEWRFGSRDRFGLGENEIFLGSRAAEFLDAKPDGMLEIGPMELRVAGIFKTENGFEDGGVFLPLKDAQDFFHKKNACSIIAVKLRDQQAGTQFKNAIEKKFPKLIALENREFNQSYTQFKILHFTAWAVGICAFLLGGLGVANTMLLSVFSRIREIAILRVCGFSGGQVAILIFGEAVAIAFAGLVLGFSLGVSVLAILQNVPQFHGYIQASVQPLIVAGIIFTAIITAVAGAIYPARFASRIQPAEALRYE